MIIRLHGEEVSHTSRGTPSFEDDFVDDSDDSLRQEFLELLDKAAHTAQKGTHADQALSASIVAAGSISVITPKPDLSSRQDSKAPIREIITPLNDRPQAVASNGGGRDDVDASLQNQLATRAATSDGKDPRSEDNRGFESARESGITENTGGDSSARFSEAASPGEEGDVADQPIPDEASIPVEALPTEESFVLPGGADLTNGEVSESDQDALVFAGLAPEEGSPIPVPTAQEGPITSALDTAKIAQPTDSNSAQEVISAAISAEGVTANQAVPQEAALEGGVQQSGTVEVTSKGGGELAQLLASLKQEQITLLPEDGEKKQIDITNPFLANAVPLLQRPDAAVKLALLKQSFEQLKGAINDVKGAQSSAQSLGSHHLAPHSQALGVGVSTQVASGEAASKMQLGFQKEASRPLPKGIAHRTMERVESALKEAAKSRDGKTLSFRLDPPQLGQVKVDVSLKDGALHARMVPENAQVATLLREKASELQSTLRRLGLNVETVTVSVGNESGSVSFTGGESSPDGKTFQQERNKMPGQEAQVVETTFGNELALQGPATKTVVDDHWVA